MAKGQKLPTLTAKDLVRVVLADGWFRVPGTKHLAFKHPMKPGKVNIDEKWTAIRAGDRFFRSVLRQASLTRREFEDLYWE
jgi:predicted RNA binding protein YcfA (HicA-like mRNA interferase family)